MNVKRNIYSKSNAGDRAIFAIVFSRMINSIMLLPVIAKDELNISPNKRTATIHADNGSVVSFDHMFFPFLGQFAKPLPCIENHDMANHLQRSSLGISAISQLSSLAFSDFLLKSIFPQVIVALESRVTQKCFYRVTRAKLN